MSKEILNKTRMTELFPELDQSILNKWDKSVPVEENSYYWKGDPIITKGMVGH